MVLHGLDLRDVPPFADCNLEFGTRLNILTGDNGVGKTFMLNIAWTALTRNWPQFKAWFDPTKSGSPTVTVRGHRAEVETEYVDQWNYSFENRRWMTVGSKGRQFSSDSRWSGPVLYLESNGNSKLWDPARTVSGNKKLLPFEFTPSSLLDGLSHGKTVACEGLVRDWVNWQRAGDPAFELLRRVLDVLSDSNEPLVPGEPQRYSLDDVRDFPTLRFPYGEVPFQSTGSGIQRIVGLAYLLVWAWQEHTKASELRRIEPTRRIVVLLDEVETHLHPRWQRLIIPAIMEAVRKLTDERAEAQILASTHSPLVLASIETLFDPLRDKLLNSELTNGLVRVRNIEWAKFGDAAGWLASPAFDIQGGGYSVEAEEAMMAADDLMAGYQDSLPQGLNTATQINDRLTETLDPTDQYWTFWRPYYHDPS